MLTPKENMRLVYQHKVPDYLPLGEDIQKIQTVEPGFKAVVYEGGTAGNEAIDWFGQNWVYEPSVTAYNPDSRNYIVKDIANWRDYVEIPDVNAIDLKKIFEARNVEVKEDKFITVKDSTGLWERAFAITPIADLLCGLLEEPEACEDLFSTVADHKIKLHAQYIDYYKPDALCMHDDYGSGQGLFMSPDTWRRLIKPHLQRVIANITSRGVMYEHHCCGYMVDLAEEIADMGASAWGMVHVVNDPYACKQKFGGKLAFVAGICDGQFFDKDATTEEQIRSHVREAAEKMLPGVGTVISTRCINYPERTKIFDDELLKCGQQYFKQKRPD
jgi:hypothetical protein